MSDWTWAQNDTGSPLVVTLRDATGAAIDLQTVPGNPTLTTTPIHGGAVVANGAAMTKLQNGNGSDGTKGIVSYQPQAADTATAGDYLGRIKATFTGGAVESFPNGGYLLITVSPTAPTSAPSTYVSLEEAKRALNLSGQQYADADLQIALTAASRGLEERYQTHWVSPAISDTRYYTAIDGRNAILGDVQTITSVSLDYGLGNYATTLLSSEYRLLPIENGPGQNGEPYRQLRLQRNHWLDLPYGDDAIKIIGTFGWAAVPAGVQAAVKIIATRFLRRQRESPFGVFNVGPDGAIVRAAQIAGDPDIAIMLEAVLDQRQWQV